MLGVAGESGIIRIGTAGTQTATFIAGIRETPLAKGVAVAVGITADGQLGVRASSARFKEAIKPMDKASEAILSLRPVTFRYKRELDPKAMPQFGLVAEQVAKVDPDLVARDAAWQAFHCPLRRSKRDVAQRVSQRASQGGGTRSNRCGTGAKTSSHRLRPSRQPSKRRPHKSRR